MAIIVGVVATILILALAVVFYLAKGARIPEARLEEPVARKPGGVRARRMSGIN
jgi:hypothetical protein